MPEDRQIIVCHEKHGEWYYDASTPEQWARSALAILTERFNQGYWYNDPGEKPAEPNGYLSKEQIEAMEEPYREQAVKIHNSHVRNLRWYREEAEQYATIKRIVEEQDASLVTVGRGRWERQAPAAWGPLADRSDGEYERVGLETVKCP
jgi:hypothetical protein